MNRVGAQTGFPARPGHSHIVKSDPLHGWRIALAAILATVTVTSQESPGPIAERLSVPAYADLGRDQHLTPLFPPDTTPSLEAWQRLRPALLSRWKRLLGHPSFDRYDTTPVVVERFDLPEFHATLMRQPTGPDTRQRVLIMEPLEGSRSPRPGAVVPFYHPDAMAGWDLARRERITEKTNTQFGLHLVRQGYVVVCPEAFPYNYVPEPADNRGLNWWAVAAAQLHRDHPGWTGMGKLVHDTSRAVDLLLAQPNIDTNRIVAIGHSLGGKMAFYAGCLDERIRATIASDFGIGWDFTNWKDAWYLGPQVMAEDFPLAHHQLLALHAPRPFLLVAGQYDKPESWHYLNAARPAYALQGREAALGMFDHAAGHQPTAEAMRLAYAWLAEHFGMGAGL